MSAIMPHRLVVLGGMGPGGTYRFADGSAAAPSVSAVNYPTTGFYWSATDQLNVAVAGARAATFQAGPILNVGVAGAAGVTIGRSAGAGILSVLNSSGIIALSLGDTGVISTNITNGNITLTPNGTGKVIISRTGCNIELNSDGLRRAEWRTDGSNVIGFGALTSTPVEFLMNGAGIARFATSGNLLLGTTTDSANGRIQLATHTTIAGGIGFGTDTVLHRENAGALALFHATNPRLLFSENGTITGSLQASAASVLLSANSSLVLRTGGSTTALTLDTSQNATFVGGIQVGNNGTLSVRFGGTSASFPALRRTGTALNVRLADDTGDGNLTAGFVGFGGAGTSGTTVLNLPAGTTAISSLRVPHGAAPTTPVNGDIWTTTAGLFVRINGVTVGPLT